MEPLFVGTIGLRSVRFRPVGFTGTEWAKPRRSDYIKDRPLIR